MPDAAALEVLARAHSPLARAALDRVSLHDWPAPSMDAVKSAGHIAVEKAAAAVWKDAYNAATDAQFDASQVFPTTQRTYNVTF